jgi:hypothetical protein
MLQLDFSGYMAPEFALEGVFSVKSDVFSFGVLLLEILSGQRNGALYLEEHHQSLIRGVRIPIWSSFIFSIISIIGYLISKVRPLNLSKKGQTSKDN